MIIFVLILVAIICSGLTVAKKGEFFGDYMSPKNTSTINAVFSVLIFLSHAVSYVSVSGPLDTPYLSLRTFLSQLVVVTYLFFSGFGIMESIKKKGTAYVKAMPVNRLFKLWYHFAIVLLMYTVVRVGIMGVKYSLRIIFLRIQAIQQSVTVTGICLLFSQCILLLSCRSLYSGSQMWQVLPSLVFFQ
jgi:hypothetical protein